MSQVLALPLQETGLCNQSKLLSSRPAPSHCPPLPLRRVSASLSKRSSRRSITTNTSICGRSFASQCRVVTERYYGELANTVHDVRLARKNVTALLVGLAIDWSNCIAQTTRFPSTGPGPTAARRQYCHSGCPNDAIGGWPRSLRIHHHWVTVLRDLADQ